MPMKLQVVTLLVAVVGAAAVAGPQCVCKDADATSTLAYLKTALSEKAGLVAKWTEVCKKESAETDAWLKTIGENSEANKKDFEAREKDKKGLADALEDRISGLKTFIKELEGILATLAEHITRTNQLYGTKYDANLQDQTAASLTLHGLSLSFEAPHNVRLNPLKQVEGVGEAGPTAAAAETPAAGTATGATGAADAPAAAEAKMMFLEMTVASRARNCKFEGCMDAYKKTFALYKTGFDNNRINKQNFEKERATLGMFRKKTREMLDKKKAKLAKLSKQLEDLKAAMAAPDGRLSDLFPLIEEHKKVFDSACGDFGTSSASGKEALTALLQAIEAKKVEVDKEDAKEPVEKPVGEVSAAETPAAADGAADAGKDTKAADTKAADAGAKTADADAGKEAKAADAGAGKDAKADIKGPLAKPDAPGATEPVPAKNPAAVSKPEEEDLTKILSTPVPADKKF